MRVVFAALTLVVLGLLGWLYREQDALSAARVRAAGERLPFAQPCEGHSGAAPGSPPAPASSLIDAVAAAPCSASSGTSEPVPPSYARPRLVDR